MKDEATQVVIVTKCRQIKLMTDEWTRNKAHYPHWLTHWPTHLRPLNDTCCKILYFRIKISPDTTPFGSTESIDARLSFELRGGNNCWKSTTFSLTPKVKSSDDCSPIEVIHSTLVCQNAKQNDNYRSNSLTETDSYSRLKICYKPRGWHRPASLL